MTDHTVNQVEHIAVAEGYYINTDMSQCPIGVKVQLLNPGGVLTYGQYDGKTKIWQGWAPLPRRRKTDGCEQETT
jgi:hypothetical protein